MEKRKAGKRFLSWLLAFAMLITMMPATAFAGHGGGGGGGYPEGGNTPKAEFWCTNSKVEISGETEKNLSDLLSGKAQLIFAQESSLQEGTLTNGSGLEGRFWKAMVQDNSNKQNGNANSDCTNVGTEITSIYGTYEWTRGGLQYQYKYLAADGTEGTLSSSQTVVLYYKQVFVKDSTYGTIYGADWGYSDENPEAKTKVTYQLAEEKTDGSTEVLAEEDYWYTAKSGNIAKIGTLLNPKYTISKITVDETEWTDGQEVSVERYHDHVVTFYIKSVASVQVQYNWIGAENLDVTLPIDSTEYDWGEEAPLTEEAALFTPNLIQTGTDGVQYMFSGWYDNPNFEGNPVEEITVSEDSYTFYGRWISNVIEIDLNEDEDGNARFQKTLVNADKLADDDEREFTISITNKDDADEAYTGTATVSKTESTAPFIFDDSQKLVFDITDAIEDGTPVEDGIDYTYTVAETSSSDDIVSDTSAYTMTVNVKLDEQNLVATVSFENAEGQTPITFTNTYTPSYPVYVYGRYMHNDEQLTGANATVNDKAIEWNEDSKINEYFITFGKIANATQTEAAEGAAEPTIWFNKNNFTLDEFSGTGSAAKNNVTLNDVDSWGALHACPGAASYNTAEEGLSTDIYAWHMNGDIKVYSVAYDDGVDDNSVTNMPSTPNGYYFGDYTAADAPEREGYDFLGWKLNNTNDTVEPNKAFTLTADTTLTAQWAKSTVTVTFKIAHGTWKDATGASGDYTANDQTLPISRTNLPYTLTTAGIPSEMQPDTGYTGGKWYRVGENGQETEISNISGEVITDDTTYIFRYEPTAPKTTVTVTFNVVNGTWDSNQSTTVSKEFTLSEDGSYTLIATDVPSDMVANTDYADGSWDIDPYNRILKEDAVFTYTFQRAEGTYYTVAYEWGSKAPDSVVLPTDNNQYVDDGSFDPNTLPIADTTYDENTIIATNNGTWTFSGWNRTVDKEAKKITFTGTWTFKENEAEPQPTGKATVIFKIEGGTWIIDDTSNSTNEDKTVEILLYDKAETGKLDRSTLPYRMQPDADHIGEGYWVNSSREEILNTEFQNGVTTIFTYKFNTPRTISGTLSTLIQKSFASRYGYSTEGTFTAKAKVMQDLPIPQLADAAYTPEEIGTYNGTVTLKTGETKAFSFVAADANQPDTLEANTTYVVEVTEDNANLSNVDYDKTEYTLTIRTNENGVATEIAITPNNGETKEAENGKITFHNIYTYKRHSSNNNKPSTPNTPPTVEIPDDDALGLNDTDHFAYIVGYGNGEVRPQNSITRAEVAAIFFRLLEDDVRDENYTRQNKFTDVSDDAWYCSAVSTLSAMGIISGYPDATFRPNAPITRAEFAAIATRFDVDGDKTPVSFSDIAGHWAKDEIAVAANNGWVNGYEDGSFRPQNNITRAETMSLVNRVLNRRPETAEDLLSNMIKWTDNADTNAWYYLAVQEATNSHYYEFKENSQYEKWTELRETRDWSELDK